MIKLNKVILKEISYYIAAIFLCCIFLCWVMHLWSADFRVPFTYGGAAPFGGDEEYVGTMIKGTIDNGWCISNHFIGMPTGLYSYDFPLGWNLDMSIMKMISFIFPNWALTMNIYFLLCFPLTVITALFVFRKIHISPLPAIVGSLLFAFIPYHFLRGEGHIAYSAYFLIPLIVLVMFWVFEDDFLLDQFKKTSSGPLLRVLNRRNIFSIIICIAVACAAIYYAFFSCFLLLVAGVCAAITKRRWTHLLNSLVLVGVIFLWVLAQNIPTFIYQHANGTNFEVVRRVPQESEAMGLKIIQLLLPINGHRIPIFAHFADKYLRTAPLVNENMCAALGIIGSIGFIILIIWLFYRLLRRDSTSHHETLKRLNQISALNLAAVLLGTIGGFGAVFAFLISPEIRGWNRISVFIAFFAITTIVLLIDFLVQRYSFSKVRKYIIWVCIVAILLFGIYDQTSATGTWSSVPDYKNIKEEFISDQHFIENIETRFPDDTMIFQLPYMYYPEHGPLNNMLDYDPFKAYLHSKNIHWSWGTMRDRYGDYWQRFIVSKPIDEMIRALSFAGFDGIYVDSYGYTDNGKEAISSISSVLNETPLVSDNGGLYFFDMTQYNVHLKSQLTSAEFEKEKNRILHIVTLEWRGGFYGLEADKENNWRWCSSQGTLIIDNTSNEDIKVIISAKFVTGYSELSDLRIESNLVTENLQISNSGYNFGRELLIRPGKHVIKFTCDAKRLYAPADLRYIVFGTYNFKMVGESLSPIEYYSVP